MDFLLSRLCDACGGMVGGGVRYCPRCRIFFCHRCYGDLIWLQLEKDLNSTFDVDCPMCGEKMEKP